MGNRTWRENTRKRRGEVHKRNGETNVLLNYEERDGEEGCAKRQHKEERESRGWTSKQ